jgi:hypothetical protein
MKTYGVRGIVPLILNLDARCWWVVGFTSRAALRPGKVPRCPLNRKLTWHHSQCGRFRDYKKPIASVVNRILDCRVRSLVTILTELSRLCTVTVSFFIILHPVTMSVTTQHIASWFVAYKSLTEIHYDFMWRLHKWSETYTIFERKFMVNNEIKFYYVKSCIRCM